MSVKSRAFVDLFLIVAALIVAATWSVIHNGSRDNPGGSRTNVRVLSR